MNLRTSLSKFIPHILFPLIKARQDFCVLKGCILFADLAGFTNLTETLASIGKEGAEELTKILNSFFEKMIDIILQNGGDVIRFGGDAMTIFVPSTIEDGLKTSILLQKECLNFQNVETKAGTFSLGMKIGVSFGDMILGIVGNEETGFDYFAAGDPLDKAAEAEHHARKGEILVSLEEIKNIDSGNFKIITIDRGFAGVEDYTGDFSISEKKLLLDEDFLPSEEQFLRFLPYYVKEKAFIEEQKLVGEHRRTTTLFLKFSNLDYTNQKSFQQLQTIFTEIAKSVKKYGGTINKIDMGDKGSKILILFGSPSSLENQEEMGVKCALEIIGNSVLKDCNCDIRIGITVSTLFSAYVGSNKRREFTVMGDGINLAARLMTLNLEHPIIVCDEIYKKLKDMCEFISYEPVTVKGKREKIKVFSPFSLKENYSLAHFVGREKEIELALNIVSDPSNSSFLCISGSAGMGKSDFLLKIKEILEDRGNETIYTRLAPYDREKFFTPLKNVISHCLNFTFRDSEDNKNMIGEALSSSDKNYLPLFNDLFKLKIEENIYTQSLSPKERKDIFFAIVSRILMSSLNKKPRHIFIDNLDYADPSTIEFLLFFSEDLKETKAKILFTLRDENREYFKELLEKSEQIKLSSFSKNEVESYLVDVEGFATPTETFLDFLLEKSGGNPKFLSELILIIKTHKIAFIGQSQKYEVDEDKLSTTVFPDTLQSLFLSKVESLSEEDKTIIRCASVLGTSFSLDTLCSLTGKERDYLILKIKNLESTSLIRMDTWGTRPYASFSDNLLQEAVYNSLNFELRRELHLKVANFLEKESVTSPRVLPVLARHYEKGTDEKKALYYLFESAKYSKSIYDYRSCFDYLYRYVSIAEKNNFSLKENPQYLEAFIIYAEVQQELGRIEEAGLCFSKIVEELTDFTPTRIKCLLKLADNKRRVGKIKESLELYEKALEEAKVLKDDSLLSQIFLYSGVPLAISGKMGKAMDYFQRAELLAQKVSDFPTLVFALMNRGLVEYFRGKLEGAKSFLIKARKIAIEKNLKSYLTLITVNLSQAYFESGEYEKALETLKEAEEISRQFGYRNHLVMSMSNRALYETMLGKWEEAEKSVEKALASAIHYGMVYLIAANYHTKSLISFVYGQFSKSFSDQQIAFETFLQNNHLGEAVGSLSELISISNQIGLPSLVSVILEEKLGKLQKELENTSRTLTISFNANYAYYEYLRGERDYYETEEKLESVLDKARESGILWLVADVGNVFMKLHLSNNNPKKAVDIGEDLFPLLSTHYCPLVIPRFLTTFGFSLLFCANLKEEVLKVLNALNPYEKFVNKGLQGIEYNLLLYKIFENEGKKEAYDKIVFAKKIISQIEENEEDKTFKEAFLSLPIIKEIKEK